MGELLLPPANTTLFFAYRAKAVIAAPFIRIYVLYPSTYLRALQFAFEALEQLLVTISGLLAREWGNQAPSRSRVAARLV